MSDLISRENAVETIKDYFRTLIERQVNQIDTVDACIDIQNIIKKLPAEQEWIPVEYEVPPNPEEYVLVQVSGRPQPNIDLEDALMLATYNDEDGWIIDDYPEWEHALPIAWQSLPEPYREK